MIWFVGMAWEVLGGIGEDMAVGKGVCVCVCVCVFDILRRSMSAERLFDLMRWPHISLDEVEIFDT